MRHAASGRALRRREYDSPLSPGRTSHIQILHGTLPVHSCVDREVLYLQGCGKQHADLPTPLGSSVCTEVAAMVSRTIRPYVISSDPARTKLSVHLAILAVPRSPRAVSRLQHSCSGQRRQSLLVGILPRSKVLPSPRRIGSWGRSPLSSPPPGSEDAGVVPNTMYVWITS